MIYGYCRISTPRQSIDRQIRNIKELYPDAYIITEVYTGTKFQERKELGKLLKKVVAGDIIVFDSVSRMSRDAATGYELYMELFDKNIDLVFLKEPYINTQFYKTKVDNRIEIAKTGNETTDKLLTGITEHLTEFMKDVAKDSIRIAFDQSEKEVSDLRQRTREGLITAKLNGKQVGAVAGRKLTTKKSIESKKQIKKLAKDFGGSNTDTEVMKILGISRNSYYKYKRELIAEL